MTGHRQPQSGDAIRGYLAACDQQVPGAVDWDAAPPPVKSYPGAPRIILPWTGPAPAAASLLRGLLAVTRLSWAYPFDDYGRRSPGLASVLTLRPAPSGGALYPIEGYLVTGPDEGRPAITHYDPAHHALEMITPGDHRDACCGILTKPPRTRPEMILALTAVFWRNGFKYGDFAYRLSCQETGVLAAQALALAGSLGLTARLHLRFDGRQADELLGLDPAAESVLAFITMTAISGTPGSRVRLAAAITPAACLRAVASPEPVTTRLPHLARLHAAARTATAAGNHTPPRPPFPAGDPFLLPPPCRSSDAIPYRASPVNGYEPTPVTVPALAAILAAAGAGYPGDLPASQHQPPATSLYVIVRRVTGLPVGAYRYDPARHALLPVSGTDPVGAVATRPLHPSTWSALATAAVALAPVGDPLAGISTSGEAWYRIQQAEAGLVTHRAALAAAAGGLASRYHSEATHHGTDAAFALTGTPWRTLAFMTVGVPPPPGPARPDPSTSGHAPAIRRKE